MVVPAAGAAPVPSINFAFLRTFITVLATYIKKSPIDPILPDLAAALQTNPSAGLGGIVSPKSGAPMPEVRLCGRCGEMIPPRRLEVLPDTRLCLPCSEEIGGDYILKSHAENLAKAGSLKKNYGDYKLARIRRRIEPKPR
jgi:Prokaryotic dksA/traR C4-type zinc finger